MGNISEADLKQTMTDDVKQELVKDPIKTLVATKVAELFAAGDFDITILDMIE